MKLSRDEYLMLQRIEAGKLPNNEKHLTKFMAHDLVISVNLGSKSCSYKASEKGKKYLEENALPPFKLSEVQAQFIYQILGDEEYECAKPANYSGSVFSKLVNAGIFKEDENKRGYVISADGKAAFEQTEIGQVYMAKIQRKQKREAMMLEFQKAKSSAIADEFARMRAMAKYFEVRGDKEYADKIRTDANKAETIVRFIGKYFSGYKIDKEDIWVELDDKGEIAQVSISDCGHVTNDKYLHRGYANSATDPRSRVWHLNTSAYMNTRFKDYDRVEKVLRYNLILLEVCKRMNADRLQYTDKTVAPESAPAEDEHPVESQEVDENE